jgi:hypothetical protein
MSKTRIQRERKRERERWARVPRTRIQHRPHTPALPRGQRPLAVHGHKTTILWGPNPRWKLCGPPIMRAANQAGRESGSRCGKVDDAGREPPNLQETILARIKKPSLEEILPGGSASPSLIPRGASTGRPPLPPNDRLQHHSCRRLQHHPRRPISCAVSSPWLPSRKPRRDVSASDTTFDACPATPPPFNASHPHSTPPPRRSTYSTPLPRRLPRSTPTPRCHPHSTPPSIRLRPKPTPQWHDQLPRRHPHSTPPSCSARNRHSNGTTPPPPQLPRRHPRTVRTGPDRPGPDRIGPAPSKGCWKPLPRSEPSPPRRLGTM